MILVTGGTGFIGSLVIKSLLEKGKSVLAIKRASSIIPQELLYKANLFWFDADVTDYFSLEDVFTQVRQVYHCAGMVSFNTADRKKLMDVNVKGTTHIVNLCLEKKARLVYLSSVAALGEEKDSGFIDEKSKWEWHPKLSGYSISKFEAEREVWRGIAEGLDAVIVNPTIVIGADNSNNTAQLFSLVDKGLRYYPTGSTGFVDVEDLASIMIQLMESPDISGTNFLINNINLSYKELFQQYARIVKKAPPSIPTNRFLLAFAWRAQTLLSFLKIMKPKLTKEIARSSIKKHIYSNEKIISTLNYSFKPFDLSLEEISH
ncbi:SDR family NAD(P)-dependent oxidoreductase [Albibacterium bauzanense]|uniref:Nucleoside-diphosphate-sugar epimerase n=1 Tax=Albibacterium bauzanense TaxID=653929 RepID=A0A4R1LWF0_9SPHI|nr:SDR family NAD(P)-dependent oxidoreductase [Albibacterium bauzanense]TCK82764.1 nucleoside-diphosphate-sugar epimerase [Albibacterium bauzanense]